MGTVFVPTDVGSGTASQGVINADLTAIQTALSRMLNVYGDSTVGTNAMQVDFDLNNQDLLNGNVGNFTSLILNGVTVVPTASDLSALGLQFGSVSVGSSTITLTIAGVAQTSDFNAHSDVGTNRAGEVLASHNATAASGVKQYLARSRGTEASPTIVVNGDTLGSIIAAGYDGVDYAKAAQIDFTVANVPGAGDMPGKITFKVSPDGSETPAAIITAMTNAVTFDTTQITQTAASGANSAELRLNSGNATNTTSSVRTVDSAGTGYRFGNDRTNNRFFIDRYDTGAYTNTPVYIDSASRLSAQAGVFIGGAGTANLLDDYEEGTFTPVWKGATTPGSPTYSTNTGRYTKVGRLLHVAIVSVFTSLGGMVGAIRVAGLPAPLPAGSNGAISVGYGAALAITAGQSISVLVNLASSSLALYLWDSATGVTSLLDTEMTNTTNFQLGGTYEVT